MISSERGWEIGERSVCPARREKKSEAMPGGTPYPANSDLRRARRLSGQVGLHATGLVEC